MILSKYIWILNIFLLWCVEHLFGFFLVAQWDSVIWKRRMQGRNLVRNPFWNSVKNRRMFHFFYLLFAIWRASSTSSTSLAIVAEMRPTRLANSGLEERLDWWDLSDSTAADAKSFAEDPSTDLRYWWLLISLALLLQSRLWVELMELVEELVLGSGEWTAWILAGDEIFQILSCPVPSPAGCLLAWPRDGISHDATLNWVEYLDLGRIQFSMRLRWKSREEIGGGLFPWGHINWPTPRFENWPTARYENWPTPSLKIGQQFFFWGMKIGP